MATNWNWTNFEKEKKSKILKNKGKRRNFFWKIKKEAKGFTVEWKKLRIRHKSTKPNSIRIFINTIENKHNFPGIGMLKIKHRIVIFSSSIHIVSTCVDILSCRAKINILCGNHTLPVVRPMRKPTSDKMLFCELLNGFRAMHTHTHTCNALNFPFTNFHFCGDIFSDQLNEMTQMEHHVSHRVKINISKHQKIKTKKELNKWK